MDARNGNIYAILNGNKQFIIPVYQRLYSWEIPQCKRLWDDIVEMQKKNKNGHFVGSIVNVAEQAMPTGVQKYLIIDGQQRLTTMYILLKALYDTAKGVSVRIETEIQEVMFNRNCEEKYKLKLKPVKTDNEQLLLLVKDKIDDMDRNSNIYKNYITFKRKRRGDIYRL